MKKKFNPNSGHLWLHVNASHMGRSLDVILSVFAEKKGPITRSCNQLSPLPQTIIIGCNFKQYLRIPSGRKIVARSMWGCANHWLRIVETCSLLW